MQQDKSTKLINNEYLSGDDAILIMLRIMQQDIERARERYALICKHFNIEPRELVINSIIIKIWVSLFLLQHVRVYLHHPFF